MDRPVPGGGGLPHERPIQDHVAQSSGVRAPATRKESGRGTGDVPSGQLRRSGRGRPRRTRADHCWIHRAEPWRGGPCDGVLRVSAPPHRGQSGERPRLVRPARVSTDQPVHLDRSADPARGLRCRARLPDRPAGPADLRRTGGAVFGRPACWSPETWTWHEPACGRPEGSPSERAS